MIGLRWSIGDVSRRGFEALRLSLWGAWKVFGPDAAYLVLVHSLPVRRARESTGYVPPNVAWQRIDSLLPAWLRERVDHGGLDANVALRMVPPRCFPDAHELALDNDLVLWSMPPTLARWLADDRGRGLLAEDVAPCYGQFADRCTAAPRSAGIRGVPPGFNVELRLRAVLNEHPTTFVSEDDEQGLWVATISRGPAPMVIGLDDVTICSPFPPHLPHLGRCGAHFVGVNAGDLGWDYDGEPAEQVQARHWDTLRSEVRSLAMPGSSAPNPVRGASVSVSGASPTTA
jgi:hypothetical protein